MRRTHSLNRPSAVCMPGFSLVELLTVIAIIVLLIGVLVPAIGHVRKTARASTTDAMINNTLATGLEMFRADGRVGGGYPPSASDARSGNLLTYRVRNPYGWNPVSEIVPGPDLQTGPIDPQSLSPDPQISGAGLLVWALLGPDGLGCAGFKTSRKGSRYWGEDTDGDADGDEKGLYSIYTNYKPVFPRSGPFIESSKVTLSKWNPTLAVAAGTNGSFEIELETKSARAVGEKPAKRLYPMFLDAFGQPVLYWRADPAGQRIADGTPNDLDDVNHAERRGIYHFRDNGGLLASGGFAGGTPNPVAGRGDDTPLQLTPKKLDTQMRGMHNLYWNSTWNSGSTLDKVKDFEDVVPNQRGFAHYIRNTSAAGVKIMPHNADSYLLISAGADGKFGTADDIANFKHNGAMLQ